jgi:hypothetical protein
VVGRARIEWCRFRQGHGLGREFHRRRVDGCLDELEEVAETAHGGG